jgi:uncharacterized protein YigE (DUF2233 family)
MGQKVQRVIRRFVPLLLVAVLVLIDAASARCTDEKGSSVLIIHELAVRLSDKEVQVTMAQFSQDAYELVVVDNGENAKAKYRDLEEAMIAMDCVAGTNGGFFERSPFEPCGLMISQGITSGSQLTKSWMNGVVAVRKGVPLLIEADSFVADSDVSDAVQAGPMLIQNGKSTGASYSGRIANRTFVCRSADGMWALGVTGPCTLNELAAILLSREVVSVISIRPGRDRLYDSAG